MKRFFKKCEEFSICSEIAKSGDYFVDGYPYLYEKRLYQC